MRLGLSDEARNATLKAIADLVDAGGSAGRIELMDADVSGRPGAVLAILKFSYPCADNATQGVLQFNQIFRDPEARRDGLAELAQVLDSDGTLVLECDVTDSKGEGVIKLNSNEIRRGAPVEIKSFRLSVTNKS